MGLHVIRNQGQFLGVIDDLHVRTPRWWFVSSEGIQVQGEKSVRRTKGKPVTLEKIVTAFGATIETVCREFDVSLQLVAAVIATESRGDPKAERWEAHLKDYSFGLMQLLTATAVGVAQAEKLDGLPKAPSAKGQLSDSPAWQSWRAALCHPEVNIRLGAAYLHKQNERQELHGDPILLYSAYNSGTARAAKTPWGVSYYYRAASGSTPAIDAMDNFAAWYGDACAVYGR